MANYTLLLLGILYVTFLPGFTFTEIFLKNLKSWQKLPLYFIFSVVLSTFLSYLASLFFGFNEIVQVVLASVFLLITIYFLFKRRLKIGWENIPGFIVFLIFFIALLPAIFRLHNGYFVMGGPNWQDTAMHLSIIESLNQGNFPPQAPYYAGQPLNYYYFSDLHAAILSLFVFGFYPQVLVILNSFLAMTFYLSIFTLALLLTKRKIFSIGAAVMATFYGGITSFQMVPMSDYFLQNRPMMVGLPIFILAIFLILKKKFLFAGILLVALLKFQLFGFIVLGMFFVFYFLVNDKKIHFKNVILFLLPTAVLLPFVFLEKSGSRSLLQIFMDTFSWGSWQKENIFWYVRFVIISMNLGIFVFVFSLFRLKVWKMKYLLPLYLTGLTLLTIPFVVSFTIYQFDMFKFFYYSLPILAITSGVYFSKIKRQKLSFVVFLLVIGFCSFLSFKTLKVSYTDNSFAYSMPDYDMGMWIRQNTSQRSVFVTMPTVHSAVSDIGGRLRIISYINWPYSHGFNMGKDNVFKRVEDVENVYKTGDVTEVKSEYNAKYIFYGSEERSKFPEAGKIFDKNKNLIKVYFEGPIVIYEIL